jgi:hypothetical protein
MNGKLFVMLAALVVVMVLAIPAMAQETNVPEPANSVCQAVGLSTIEIMHVVMCQDSTGAFVSLQDASTMALPSVAEATSEVQPVLTAEQAERLVLEVLEPMLLDCTDAFLSGQLVSFLRTETYEDPDLNQFGFKLREDLSEGLVVATNTCAMLSMVGVDGRIRYDVAGWAVYDGTEKVDIAYDGVPTTFWWSAQGLVHQGNVEIGPVAFTFDGPQQFTAGAFSDNMIPGLPAVGPLLGGPDCVSAFMAGAQLVELQAACLQMPEGVSSASASR